MKFTCHGVTCPKQRIRLLECTFPCTLPRILINSTSENLKTFRIHLPVFHSVALCVYVFIVIFISLVPWQKVMTWIVRGFFPGAPRTKKASSTQKLPLIFASVCRMHVCAYLNWVAENREAENIAKFAHNMEKLFDDCAAHNLRIDFVWKFCVYLLAYKRLCSRLHSVMEWFVYDEQICVNIIQALVLFAWFISDFLVAHTNYSHLFVRLKTFIPAMCYC